MLNLIVKYLVSLRAKGDTIKVAGKEKQKLRTPTLRQEETKVCETPKNVNVIMIPIREDIIQDIKKEKINLCFKFIY